MEIQYHEIEGGLIAKDILEKLNAKPEIIDEVCDIINHHHHPKDVESVNYKVLYDIDLIANIEDNYKDKSVTSEELKDIIKRANFLTRNGCDELIKFLTK